MRWPAGAFGSTGDTGTVDNDRGSAVVAGPAVVVVGGAVVVGGSVVVGAAVVVGASVVVVVGAAVVVGAVVAESVLPPPEHATRASATTATSARGRRRGRITAAHPTHHDATRAAGSRRGARLGCDA